MREVPRLLRDELADRDLGDAGRTLPEAIFDPAYEEYVDGVRRRSAHRQRRPWWKLWQ